MRGSDGCSRRRPISEREALGMAVGRVFAEWDELDFALGFGSFFEGLPYRDPTSPSTAGMGGPSTRRR